MKTFPWLVALILLAPAARAASLDPEGGPEASAGKSVSVKKRILYIGDSHSTGPFGRTLDKLLRSTGAEVTTQAICSSAGRHWAKGYAHKGGLSPCSWMGAGSKLKEGRTPVPKVGDLLSTLKPDVLVIALGSNPVGKKAESWAHDPLAAVLKDRGQRCVWIGPPNMTTVGEKGMEVRVQAVKAAAAKAGCRFVDSRPHAPAEAQDRYGIHYKWSGKGGKLARAWASGVFAEFKDELR